MVRVQRSKRKDSRDGMRKRDLELCSNTGLLPDPCIPLKRLKTGAGQHQQIDIWRNPTVVDMWRMDWKGTREEDQFAGQCTYPGQR